MVDDFVDDRHHRGPSLGVRPGDRWSKRAAGCPPTPTAALAARF